MYTTEYVAILISTYISVLYAEVMSTENKVYFILK